MAHVKNNSGNNEWYTPIYFIKSAHIVMGSINLDPASSDIANKSVQANVYYTQDNSGLDKEWHGNVWMNPPYSRNLLPNFIDKLVDSDITQAIVLVNNATETQWAAKLLAYSDAVCFIKKRIKFIDIDGNDKLSGLQGQMICYKGHNVSRFIDEFSQYGVCLKGEVK
jgi:phage N-6-adenine-methyltransferase